RAGWSCRRTRQDDGFQGPWVAPPLKYECMRHPGGKGCKDIRRKKYSPAPDGSGDRAFVNDPVYAGTFFGCAAGGGFVDGIAASISASSSAARGPATIMPTRCWDSA